MPEPPSGLRARKKRRTRALIQEEAMRLFLDRGFRATTVEDIAEAAEVSPSTVFNYFPSKEDVVMQDDLDPAILAAYVAQPSDLSPISALRNAMRQVFLALTPEQDRLFRARLALIVGDEDLRAAMLVRFAGMLDEVSAVVARKAHRDARDFQVRNLAGAVLGVMMSAVMAAAENPQADLVGQMDAAFQHLESGLPLG